MKTAVIYYSWSGHTEKLAQDCARQEKAALYKIEDLKRPCKLKACTAGVIAAMRMKRAPIKDPGIPFEDYERLIIMAPVWAGHPAPAINSVFDALPAGKEVSIRLVAASGGSECAAKLEALVAGRACKLTGIEHIKG